MARHGAQDLASVAALNPEVLYREFGVNAEYLIDHAWGQEPCTIAEIQAYEPEGRSLVNGQVLPSDYTFEEARMVLREMVDASVLELVEHGLVTERISLSVGYARKKGSWNTAETFEGGHGTRLLGAHAAGERTGGSRKLERRTNSACFLIERFESLFDETAHRDVPIRRINVGFSDLLAEQFATATLFDNTQAEAKERQLQDALIAVRGKFGKNAMLKGTSLQKKATARERNEQVGGHHA